MLIMLHCVSRFRLNSYDVADLCSRCVPMEQSDISAKSQLTLILLAMCRSNIYGRWQMMLTMRGRGV